MNRKKDISGLIFSALLVIAFVICSYFFLGVINESQALNELVKKLLCDLVFVLFGLVLFYATRVGDGRQVKRFSLPTLIVLVLPALYLILASAAEGIPCPLDLTKYKEVVILASVAFGYGIPYTFLSGYELDSAAGSDEEEDQSDNQDEDEPEKTDEPEENASSDEGSETTETASSEEDNGEDDSGTPEDKSESDS